MKKEPGEGKPRHYMSEGPDEGKPRQVLHRHNANGFDSKHLIEALLLRARDPDPEKPFVTHQHATAVTPGWLPLLTLANALGLLSIAYAFTDSRDGGKELAPFFLLGLMLMFVPAAVRLLLPAVSRGERIGLLCVLGIACYLVKVMSSPLYFSFYDEFLHWRTVNDIVRSGHLFNENALLPVSPYYPGLEIVTTALSSLSGLSTFYAGLIVIGVARLLMVLSLFLLCEQVLKSARMAGLATLLYMTNPHFLMFDAQFGYESLALPLATFVMYAMAPHQNVSVRLDRLKPIAPFMKFSTIGRKELRSDLRWIVLSAWIAVIAIVLTHHVTDFFLDGLLFAWTITYACMRLTPLYRSNLARTALLALCLSAVSIVRPGNPIIDYLSSFFSDALDELGHILIGTGSARRLFVTYAGQPLPIWERLLTLSSVAIILFCLPFGLLCLWQRYRSNAFVYTLGILSLCYPISQAFRLTNSGSELTDRAAAFLFIAIASVLAILIVQFWPTRTLNWRHIVVITSVMSVVFMGGTVLGIGPSFSGLPGPYVVGADSRSIEPEGIEAAIWTSAFLGPDNRMATDRINQVLMGTYGNQRIVNTIEDKIDLSPLFLSPCFDGSMIDLLRSSNVRYLVLDMRLTQSLPLLGYYYEQAEDGAFHHKTPIDPQNFTKFSHFRQMNRVFDSGNIVIYDAAGVRSNTSGSVKQCA